MTPTSARSPWNCDSSTSGGFRSCFIARKPKRLEIVRLYGQNCIPIPRKSERHYWSVSCLPSTSDKPLVRVNASWMELFTLYAEGEGIRARFLVHLSDFTTDHSPTQCHLDEPLLEYCVTTPEDVGYFFPRGEDILAINVRGLRLDPQIPRDPPSVACHSEIQSDAHEPGSERLPGEPLLQLGGLLAGRLSGSGMSDHVGQIAWVGCRRKQTWSPIITSPEMPG